MSHKKSHKKCSRWSHCGRKKHKKKMRQKKKAAKAATAEEGENDPDFKGSCERDKDDKEICCHGDGCASNYADAQGKGGMTGRETEAGGETVSETIYIGGKWMPATEENLKKCRNTHDCFMQFLNEDGSLRDHNDPVPESHTSVPSGGPLTPGTVPTNVATYADGSQV
jgi:hypothetical protein